VRTAVPLKAHWPVLWYRRLNSRSALEYKSLHAGWEGQALSPNCQRMQQNVSVMIK
jgi:hypothetical protein